VGPRAGLDFLENTGESKPNRNTPNSQKVTATLQTATAGVYTKANNRILHLPMRNSRKVLHKYCNRAEPPLYQTYTSNMKQKSES
jgi:hypothetical protein